MGLILTKEEIKAQMEHNRPIMEGQHGSIVDNYSKLMTNIDKEEILRAKQGGGKIEEKLAEKNKKNIVTLSIEDLSESPSNVFNEYNDKKKQEMIESIKEHGVLEAIFVRPASCIQDAEIKHKVTGKYEILAGHNRVKCATVVGLTEIPAIIIDADDSTAAVFITQTNVQRDNVSDVERARAMRLMYEKYKKDKNSTLRQNKNVENSTISPMSQNGTSVNRTDETVAEEFGVSKNSLHRQMALAYCTEDVVKYYEAGRGRTNLNQEQIYLIHKMNKGTQNNIPVMLKAVGAKMTTAKAKQLKEEYAIWHAEEQPRDNLSFPPKRMREIFQEDLGTEATPKKKRSVSTDSVGLKVYHIPDKYFPKEITSVTEREKYLINILGKMNG